MCGMNGHWGYAGRKLERNEALDFTDSLAHRGPDGHGIENLDEGRLWLGHRRLSIIDVSSRGHQPMAYADDRYWLTYNGEVYNYIELRKELEGKGHRFRSDSDSEVILASYVEWGAQCLSRFNGMWAFAIWDAKTRKLFLARDRYGIKPLHYRIKDGTFSFASELKAFLSLPDADGELDQAILAETLVNINGQESTEYTLLPSVQRLPGGHFLEISANGSLQTQRWWDPHARENDVPSGLKAQAKHFRELFFDSCRLRLRSDVPIATSLSGGLDSSAVACVLSELRRQGVFNADRDGYRAFIACFPGNALDERHFAEKIVEHTQMTPIYDMVDEKLALTEIDRVLFDLEGIYWVPLIGPWSIYRAMRNDGISVSLDGHGADELLGGYNFFVERALDGLISGHFSLQRYLDLRRVLKGLVGGSAAIGRASIKGELTWYLKRELNRLGLMRHIKPAAQRFERAANLIRQLARHRFHSVAEPEGKAPLPSFPTEPLLQPLSNEPRLYNENADERTKGMSALNSMLFTWFHGSVLPTILRSYDRASMSHGIEVRMPFMDWRIVNFGAGLPEESKIGGGYTKRVLREAMTGLMPDDIRLRTKKIGFTSPLDEWMKGSLKEWALDNVASQSFQQSNIWNGKSAQIMLENALAGHGSVNAVWPVIHAHVLQKTFRSKAQNKLRKAA